MKRDIVIITCSALLAGSLACGEARDARIPVIGMAESDVIATSVTTPPEGARPSRYTALPAASWHAGYSVAQRPAVDVIHRVVPQRSNVYRIYLTLEQLAAMGGKVPVDLDKPQGAIIEVMGVPASAPRSLDAQPVAAPRFDVAMHAADGTVLPAEVYVVEDVSAEFAEAANQAGVQTPPVGVRAIHLNDLAPGSYTIAVSDLVEAGGVVVEITQPDGPLLTTYTATTVVYAGDKVRLMAELAGAREVIFEVKSRTGSSFPSLAARDDGLAGDAAARDGIWTAEFVPVLSSSDDLGLWDYRVRAQATPQPGVSALREGFGAFEVSAPLARFYLPSSSWRSNHAGELEALVFEVPVSTTIQSRFEVRTQLYGRDENGELQPIATAHGGATLDPGDATIQVEYPAWLIRESGLAGPYQLRDVVLSAQDYPVTLMRARDVTAVEEPQHATWAPRPPLTEYEQMVQEQLEERSQHQPPAGAAPVTW